MVKVVTSKGEFVVEFEYDTANAVTYARLLKRIEPATTEDKPTYSVAYAGWTRKAKEDVYNKFIARKVALSRAFTAGEFDRQERAFLWAQFFEQCRIA